MKRLLIRGSVFLLALYAFACLLVRFGIPFAVRLVSPGIAAYFAPLRAASVAWDPLCAAVISASCYLTGAIRRRGMRVLCSAIPVMAALCMVQVNTVPLFRIVQAAVTLLGG